MCCAKVWVNYGMKCQINSVQSILNLQKFCDCEGETFHPVHHPNSCKAVFFFSISNAFSVFDNFTNHSCDKFGSKYRLILDKYFLENVFKVYESIVSPHPRITWFQANIVYSDGWGVTSWPYRSICEWSNPIVNILCQTKFQSLKWPDINKYINV